MTPRPIHPDLIPLIPMRYTATITTHNGWWNRYRVDRLHGIGIPECSYSGHRTLKSAQRAARRWVAKNDRAKPTIVEAHR